jgi:hypothetical protein
MDDDDPDSVGVQRFAFGRANHIGRPGLEEGMNRISLHTIALNGIALSAARWIDRSPPGALLGRMECGFPFENAETVPSDVGHAS